MWAERVSGCDQAKPWAFRILQPLIRHNAPPTLLSAQGCVFELLAMFSVNVSASLNVSLNLQRHFAGYITNNPIYYELLHSKSFHPSIPQGRSSRTIPSTFHFKSPPGLLFLPS